jgi:drug/metabolite transporter (DMT)-like permease
VAVGALLPGALAGLLFARGLARIGAARASVLTYLEPLVSVAIGVVIWREPATRWTAMGCAMVIVAGLVVTRATPRRPRGTHA